MLQDSLAQMLKGNKEFYMIDNQKIIYEYALSNAIDTVSKNKKNVMNLTYIVSQGMYSILVFVLFFI